MSPSNPAAGDVTVTSRRRVTRHYRLMNRCSSKHVRITSRHVDAHGDYADIYGQFIVMEC